MTRIAHLSDSHFDERGRLDDVVRAHRLFVRACHDHKVDLIVHAGDWYERASTPRERLAVANFLLDAAEVAPVFGVKGNHDRPQDVDIFNELGRTEGKRFPIVVVDRPDVFRVDKAKGYPFLIAAVPWFDKAHVASQLDATTDREGVRQLTMAAARTMVQGLAAMVQSASAPCIKLLVGHVMVGGSEVSSGQTLIGTSVEFSPADLSVGFDYVALGHVHLTQTWYGGRIAYSGSPHRCNFGEPETKGFRLVTLENDGTFASNEFVELPGRAMLRAEDDFTRGLPQDIFEHPGWFQNGIKGALVRWRVAIRAQDLHLLPPVAAMEAEVARRYSPAEIKVEVVVESEQRQRAPEIATATTVRAKVEAWAKSKGVEVGDGVWSKLQEIERA